MNYRRTALVLIISILFVASAFAEELPALFAPAAISGHGISPLVSQTGSINASVDFSVIHPEQTPHSRIAAVLPGRIVTLVKSRTEQRGPASYTWFGKVENDPLSTAVLTVVDGIMEGHIDTAGETYAITLDNGNYLIQLNDPSLAAPEDSDERVRQAPQHFAPLSYTVAPLADSGAVIDVLVLYTQEMYNTYGPSGNNTLNAKIQSYIDLSNTAYVNSQINTSLRLVNSQIYTDANASEAVLSGNALSYLSDDPAVATLRNTYQADLVSLLWHYTYSASDSGCGVGWLTQDPAAWWAEQNGFSIVKVRTAAEANPYYCRDLSFPHELGHNMGCAHNRANASSGGAYPYSYGYDYQAAGIATPTFGTVMSYVGTRITYFSNPNITHPSDSSVFLGVSGGPTGTDNPTTSADNSRTINNSRTYVANFRVAADSTPPTDGTLSAAQSGCGQVSLSWSGFSDSGTGLRTTNTYLLVRGSGSMPNAQCANGTQVYLGTGTSTVDSVTANGVANYYRLCAYDNANNISSGTTASLAQYQLVTTSNPPAGGGTSPNCSGGCWCNSGATINLQPSTAGGYTFTGWSGSISSYSPAIAVLMDTNKNMTANFDSSPVLDPVRILSNPPDYRSTIRAAYDAASPNDIIQIQTGAYPVLTVDRGGVPVTLSGGYNSSFSSSSGATVIQFPFTVTAGAATLDNITIQ